MSYRVPQDIVESVKRYVVDRIPPGGFLHAVLSNDLEVACVKADDNNRLCFFDIVGYCFDCTPWICRGSAERVSRWLKGTELEPAEATEEER